MGENAMVELGRFQNNALKAGPVSNCKYIVNN